MARCSSGSTAAWSTSASWSGCRKPAFSSRVTLASSRSTEPSAVLASGLTSTRVASSATKACHSLTAISTICSATSAGKPAAATISRAFASSTPLFASMAILATFSGVSARDLLDVHAAGHAGDAEEGAVRAVEQVREVVLLGHMSAVTVIMTLWTVWPLMSMPRMSVARATASSTPSASLTPPALPRPPTLTCALTTTRSPRPLGDRLASSGVVATPPASTGNPCRSNRSRPWYSYRSTIARPVPSPRRALAPPPASSELRPRHRHQPTTGRLAQPSETHTTGNRAGAPCAEIHTSGNPPRGVQCGGTRVAVGFRRAAP